MLGKIREINASRITDEVKKLCIDANYYLNDDIRTSITNSIESEQSNSGRIILESLLHNADIACDRQMAICQDTGMVVVFIDIGQDVHIVDGSIAEAIDEGVRQGYSEGFLRKSVVSHPFIRENTRNNTPAIVHYNIVSGDRLRITVAPKGFGSENMSALRMLKPSEGIDGVKSFIIDTVSKAGANPCPPIVVGVGIGGTIEKCAFLAKRSLLRPIGVFSEDQMIAEMEKDLLDKINKLGIGPQGLGGTTTALAVNILTYPTHIAGLPVCVNISCHVTRHAEVTI